MPQEEDYSYSADDESLDSSSSDVSSDDFDYEILYFQIKSELNKLKKIALQSSGSSRLRVGDNEHRDHVSPRFDP